MKRDFHTQSIEERDAAAVAAGDFRAGDTYLNDGDDFHTSGIDVGEHGNRVVCYGRPEAAAIELRDFVLAAMLEKAGKR